MASVAFSRFLGYFVAVARSGSIRRAAEVLHVSASAIDRQILRAEDSFGFPLFERLPSGLRLTAAGELVLDAAQRWGRDYEQMLARMEDLRGLRRGHVRLAVIEALAKGFLPRMIAAVRGKAPGITFDIEVLDNDAVIGAVERGDVDFGVALNPRASRVLSVNDHIEVGLGFIAQPGHPLAARRTARFHHAAPYPMVAPTGALAMTDQFEALQAASGAAIRSVAASGDIQMIKSLVICGVGVSVLAWIDVLEEVERGELLFIPLGDPMLRPMTLAVCTQPSRQLSIPARIMLDRVEGELDRLARGFAATPATAEDQ